VSTFAAVRSANASARVTERSLLANIRPVLVPSRLDDPPEKISFQDNHWIKVGGGRGVTDVTDEAIYLGVALRNAGSGMAVLDRWQLYTERPDDGPTEDDIADFHRLTRDIYLADGDRGFWQGALRDPEDPQFKDIRATIEARERFFVDLLYGDLEGGQRTVTRIGLLPGPDDTWLAAVSRHWHLDREDPR
jgi:hypothetical protein